MSHNAQHVSYPHEPGRLYDCPACEGQCHCKPGDAECVYDGRHNVQSCACGIPNRASWFVHVILGREGETDYSDIYACDEHFTGYPDGSMSTEEARSLLKWDGSEDAAILEHHATHLR